ncbi:hypothetical protein BAY60_06615 [Prauserella muralis]|uniref:Carboxylic ester hydrolase n=1 Tax=Prauserella muralis TaxID=588067 RepID=A0A2V4B9N0_9PSEU|nr:hypothetical protein BAY60_06615 [Prauserella muralis]
MVAIALAALAMCLSVALPRAGSAAATRSITPTNPVVHTTGGDLRGHVEGDHVIWRGVPYAAPPVGELRFRAPRPPAGWEGIRDATAPAPACPQTYQHNGPPTYTGDEDCLYLNIWKPKGTTGPKPVLVFFHGGGFTGGDGSLYDPRRVTRQGDVIVVTVNYRLGALGFLRHPALHDPWAGNFGIADQQAALRWVRANIAWFGGARNNVTIWGESAGAFGVCAQLALPSSAGLFDKAINHSGPCGNDFLTLGVAERRGRVAAKDVGCQGRDVLACLRQVPAKRMSQLYWQDARLLVTRIADLPWLPVAGTVAIPRQPIDAVPRGRHVPMLLTTNQQEMRTYIVERLRAGLGLVTEDEYPRLIHDYYGRAADQVLAEYPASTYPTPSDALAAVLSDDGRAVGACPQLEFAAKAGGRTFAAEFTVPTGEAPGGFPEGAAHGADMPYFLDPSWGRGEPMTDEEARYARRLIDHWTDFARTGNPGWAPYRHGIGRQLTLQHEYDVDLAAEHRCGFWDTVR